MEISLNAFYTAVPNFLLVSFFVVVPVGASSTSSVISAVEDYYKSCVTKSPTNVAIMQNTSPFLVNIIG